MVCREDLTWSVFVDRSWDRICCSDWICYGGVRIVSGQAGSVVSISPGLYFSIVARRGYVGTTESAAATIVPGQHIAAGSRSRIAPGRVPGRDRIILGQDRSGSRIGSERRQGQGGQLNRCSGRIGPVAGRITFAKAVEPGSESFI